MFEGINTFLDLRKAFLIHWKMCGGEARAGARTCTRSREAMMLSHEKEEPHHDDEWFLRTGCAAGGMNALHTPSLINNVQCRC